MRNEHTEVGEIRLVHVADVHLGFQTSLTIDAGNAAGRPLREVDIEKALVRLTKNILAADPPVDLVVVAGDLFHSNTPRPFAVAAAARFVHQMTSEREDGSAIDVVIVDGNHDSPNRRETGSPTTFLAHLDAHVINGGEYRTLRDEWRNPRLHGRLIAHCLPYSAMTNEDFAGVRPHPGAINILVAHGRVRDMAEVNSLHRSAAWIPKDVVRRGWEYVALGDWHQHRHRPLSDAHAYYPGSLEALTFGEAAHYPTQQHDPYAVHGALDVRLRAPRVEPRILTFANSGARPVIRLQSIDAERLDADGLMTQLRGRLEGDLPKAALAHLEITKCDQDAWNQLDHEELGKLRARVCQCQIRPDFVHHEVEQSAEAFQLATVADQWRAYVDEKEPDERLREVLYAKGLERFEAARLAVRGQLSEAGLA